MRVNHQNCLSRFSYRTKGVSEHFNRNAFESYIFMYSCPSWMWAIFVCCINQFYRFWYMLIQPVRWFIGVDWFTYTNIYFCFTFEIMKKIESFWNTLLLGRIEFQINLLVQIIIFVKNSQKKTPNVKKLVIFRIFNRKLMFCCSQALTSSYDVSNFAGWILYP